MQKDNNERDIYMTAECQGPECNKERRMGVVRRCVSMETKSCLLVILLFLCGALLIVIIFLAVYSLSTFKEKDFWTQYLQLETNFSELHMQYSILKENHTELHVKYAALDTYCPVWNRTTRERICSYCPVNWLLFNFKCYFISNDEMNWWDSQNNCRSLDGHLVIIESEEEQKFLVNKTRTSGHTDSYYWIGLSDQVTEGDFLWVDGTPLYINLSFWGQMEPDNWKYNDNHPAGEDCVEMQINRKYYGWHDSLCHVQKKRICEREGQPVHE
ncbi:C-type lectin domain family 6 member A-like [Polypterus senegalus]|uniref:C-type lectin domain family 6 member A-like n=1 Tax=Polypterus senegalus TaxID=55291 RepID=UPI0019646535|nr:C-type lectin domain family 6 member A-like [Polypterus senegalus]